MSSSPVTVEPVQLRLLDAAERLIGARGIDGVSVRAINAEAEGNVAAAHYHYGSKEGLVRAVLARRMSALADERFAMLAVLDADPAPSPGEIAEVLTAPLVRLAATDDGVTYVRFLAALDRAGEPWRQLLEEGFRPQWERLGPVVARAMPAVPDGVRDLRMAIAGTTLLHLLADTDRYAGLLAPDRYREEVVGVITSILSGTPTH
jgi:AcrR family transcriptional regulator